MIEIQGSAGEGTVLMQEDLIGGGKGSRAAGEGCSRGGGIVEAGGGCAAGEPAQNNLYTVNRFVAVDANNVYAEAGTNFGTPPQWPSLWITYAWRQLLGPSPPYPAILDGRLGSAASVDLRSANFAVPAGQT